MNAEVSIQEKRMRGTERADRPASQGLQGTIVKDVQKFLKKSGYEELTNRGKAFYRHLCNSMMKSDRLYEEDIHMLIVFASQWDKFWTLEKSIKDYGMVMEEVSREGNPRVVANPAVAMQSQVIKNLNMIGEKFGFSPLDRQKIKAVQIEKDDPLMEFIRSHAADNQ